MRKTIAYLLSSGILAAGLSVQAQQPKAVPGSAPASSMTAPVTVRTIEQSLAKSGGKATLQKYFCGADLTGLSPSYAMKQVATGSKQWVDVVVKLTPYSDAGCSLAIHDALGAAMQKQPRNVLPHVGKSSSLSAQYICLPFLPEEMPNAKALQEVRLTKVALTQVHDKTLSRQRQACLKEVDRVEKVILADMAKKK